ncbi:MAG TPA: CPBP family intramembrane metalloprotease, partial [Limosilactobacillus ingluviei]|nr:CPBP family intramembrane metalloprotease [Limosilactobacillus ingluviei]
AFSTSGSTAMMGNPTLADWYLLAVEVLFFTGITIWMFLGDRYQVMERHARRLTGENQRFGYRLTFE